MNETSAVSVENSSQQQYEEQSYLLPHGHGMRVIGSFLNPNNEVFGFYNGSERYPIQREYYSPTYSFGLRWTSGVESPK